MKSFANIFKGFAAIAVMALALVSCSKQKSEEYTVVGDWKAEYATQKTYANGVLTSEEIHYIDDDVMLVSVNADGTAQVITYEKGDIDADVEVMNWTLEGNVLKLVNAAEPEYVTVVTVNFHSPDLVTWEFALGEETGDTNGDGVTEREIASYTMSRVK